MTLQPFFSLSPLDPYAYTYDAANPNAPYAHALQYSFGGMTLYTYPHRLDDQYNNEELILGYDPVDPAEQTIGDLVADVYRRSALRIYFTGNNVSTENQYLLLFSIRSIIRLAQRAVLRRQRADQERGSDWG